MILSSLRHSDHETHPLRAVVPPRPTQYFARLALDPHTREDAYRLRYDSYLTSGFIEPNETRLFQDLYDELPNCQTTVLYNQGMPVASVRTCTLAFGSRQRSPAMDAYPSEVTELLSQQSTIGVGGRGIETTRLVRSPAAENNQGLVFLLYRLSIGGISRDDGPYPNSVGVCAPEPCTVLPATWVPTGDNTATVSGP
jgi:hypothetical protein